MPMLLNATRSDCVVTILLTIAAAGCGQDLDLGQLTGKDGWTLPPPRDPGQARCVVADPAALRPPTRCFPAAGIFTSTTKTNDGPTFTWTFGSEFCVVNGDGSVRGPLDSNDHAACPIGLYFKFAPRPFHQPILDPVFPPDPTFPDAVTFERSVAVYRQIDPAVRAPDQWHQPFVSPGFETIPRAVQVFPEEEAVFVTLDPRTGRNEMFWVMLSFRDLFPGAQSPVSPPRTEPLGLGWILNVAAGAAPVVEKRLEARSELGLQARFRDTSAARP